jgi:hypothetical protein
MGNYGLDVVQDGTVESTYEHTNEPFVSIKYLNILSSCITGSFSKGAQFKEDSDCEA